MNVFFSYVYSRIDITRGVMKFFFSNFGITFGNRLLLKVKQRYTNNQCIRSSTGCFISKVVKITKNKLLYFSKYGKKYTMKVCLECNFVTLYRISEQ